MIALQLKTRWWPGIMLGMSLAKAYQGGPMILTACSTHARKPRQGCAAATSHIGKQPLTHRRAPQTFMVLASLAL